MNRSMTNMDTDVDRLGITKIFSTKNTFFAIAFLVQKALLRWFEGWRR